MQRCLHASGGKLLKTFRSDIWWTASITLLFMKFHITKIKYLKINRCAKWWNARTCRRQIDVRNFHPCSIFFQWVMERHLACGVNHMYLLFLITYRCECCICTYIGSILHMYIWLIVIFFYNRYFSFRKISCLVFSGVNLSLNYFRVL